jgi:hypothetical protein
MTTDAGLMLPALNYNGAGMTSIATLKIVFNDTGVRFNDITNNREATIAWTPLE